MIYWGDARLLSARDSKAAIETAIQRFKRTARPGEVGKPLGRLAGSFVPTIASDLAEAVDPKQREAEGFVGQVAKRIPGAGQLLPEATDALGRPLEDQGPLEAMIDPSDRRQQKS